MAYRGICGTDLHGYLAGPIFVPPQGTKDPHTGAEVHLILGHEFGGTIDEVGADVDGFTIGQKVAVNPALHHRHHGHQSCEQCLTGCQNRCESLVFCGLSQGQGGFAERIVVKPVALAALPQNILLKLATLAEPLAVAAHMIRMYGFRPNQNVLVLKDWEFGILIRSLDTESPIGFDQGVFGGLLADPNLLRTSNDPDTTIRSQIVSTCTIGCIVGALLRLAIGDILGRRRSVTLGCAFLPVEGIFQATAYTLPLTIIGRVIGGLGIGVKTTTIPLWQSETCKPSLRAKLVAIQVTFLVFGFVLTNWINFGFTYIPNNPVSF